MTSTAVLLTIAQAAQQSNCSERTVQRAIEAGELPVRRLRPRLVLIHPADLAAWWDASREGGNA